MRARRILAGLLALAALAGCGGAGDDPGSGTAGGAAAASGASTAASPAPAALDARALARRALIRLSDFPYRWRQESAPVTDLRCDGTDPFVGASTLVGSRRIVLGDTGIQETVAVFPTAAASRRAYVRINSRTALRCLRRDARQRVTEEAEGPARPLQLARVEPLGKHGKAMRFTTTAISSYGVVSGYIDAVHLQAGRMLGALVIVSGLSLPDEDVYERTVGLFRRRLHAPRS